MPGRWVRKARLMSLRREQGEQEEFLPVNYSPWLILQRTMSS